MSGYDGKLFMYHGGILKHQPHLHYEGGSVEMMLVEVDRFSFWDLEDMVKNLEYPSYKKMLFGVPGEELNNGLREIHNSDQIIIEMGEVIVKHKEIAVYVIHDEDLLSLRKTKKNVAEKIAPKPTGNITESVSEFGGLNPNAGTNLGGGRLSIAANNIDYIDDEVPDSIDLDSVMNETVKKKANYDRERESESDESDAEEYSRSRIRLTILTDDEDDSELEEAREDLGRFHQGIGDGNETNKQYNNFEDKKADPNESEHEEFDNGNATDYPDTSDYGSFETSGSDEDSAIRRKSRFPIFNNRQEKPEFEVSMLFETFDAFKEALKRYAIKERIEFIFTKNCKEWVRAKCKKPICPWKISACFVKDLNCVQVKTFVNTHECNPVFKNRRISAKWLAENIFHDLSCIAKLSLEDMKKLVKRQLQLEVNHPKCLRTKDLVIKSIRGDAKKEYAQLWDYKAEIERSNPGTTVILDYIRPDLGRGLAEFDRMYLAFDCCKRGFLAGCRKIIGFDGSFLKGVVKGQILAAVGRDANNQMFPIAWAVVVSESIETWTWFVKLLKKDLSITNGEGWAIISDQHVGLVNAIKHELPGAERRCCNRHLFANWRKKHKGLTLQRMFWQAVKAPNEQDFNLKMAVLKEESPEAHDDMLKYDKENWCKTYFNLDIKCDIVDNNLCEAFNGKIVFARAKAIISMLEDIRIYVMRRLKKNYALADKWNTDIGHRMKRKIRENMKDSQICEVEWNGSGGYEIKHRRDRFVVKLDKQTCTCRTWMLSSIPCAHALCAIEDRGDDPELYVSHWLKKDKYRKTYKNMMQPVAGARFWPVTGNEPLQPPPYRKVSGRPKKNRRREEWEQMKSGQNRMCRVGMKMTCKICKKQGHNKKTCPQKETQPANPVPVQESQQKFAPNQPKDGKRIKHCISAASKQQKWNLGDDLITPELPKQDSQAIEHTILSDSQPEKTTANKTQRPLTRIAYNVITPQQLLDQIEEKKKKVGQNKRRWR